MNIDELFNKLGKVTFHFAAEDTSSENIFASNIKYLPFLMDPNHTLPINNHSVMDGQSIINASLRLEPHF